MSSVGRVLVSVGDESSPGLVAYVKGGEHVRDLMVRVGERCSVKKGSFYLMLGKHYLHPDDPADVLRYDETVRLVMGTFDPMAQYKLGRPEDGDNNMATASHDHVEKEATQPVEVVPGVVPAIKAETTGGDGEDNGRRSAEKELQQRNSADAPPRRRRRDLRLRTLRWQIKQGLERPGTGNSMARDHVPRWQIKQALDQAGAGNSSAGDRAAMWRESLHLTQAGTCKPRVRNRAARRRNRQNLAAGTSQGQQVVRLNHAGFNQDEAAEGDTRETDQVEQAGTRYVNARVRRTMKRKAQMLQAAYQEQQVVRKNHVGFNQEEAAAGDTRETEQAGTRYLNARERRSMKRKAQNLQAAHQEQQGVGQNHVGFNQDEAAAGDTGETDEADANLHGNNDEPQPPCQPLTTGAEEEESESDLDLDLDLDYLRSVYSRAAVTPQ